jgi:hypothetical protein
MADRDEQYVTNGENEEKTEHPSKEDEAVEGGRPLEDSPLTPGGATADTAKNIASPRDDPAEP